MIGLDAIIRDDRLLVITDAIDNGTDEYTSATLTLYSGIRPATADAITDQDELAVFDLPQPCGVVTDGVLEFNAVSDTNGLVNGTATWARILSGAEDFVMDLSVSVTSGDGDIKMDSTVVAIGVAISCSLATFTEGNI